MIKVRGTKVSSYCLGLRVFPLKFNVFGNRAKKLLVRNSFGCGKFIYEKVLVAAISIGELNGTACVHRVFFGFNRKIL